MKKNLAKLISCNFQLFAVNLFFFLLVISCAWPSVDFIMSNLPRKASPSGALFTNTLCFSSARSKEFSQIP